VLKGLGALIVVVVFLYGASLGGETTVEEFMNGGRMSLFGEALA